uniref:translation initiation factor IF-2-like n=1 Tax=Callithrix jacchus TaxID=9483 RepID=UPI0023DD2B0A|nr:translation initiation factor IF-2-like [Callithrix jacchus]
MAQVPADFPPSSGLLSEASPEPSPGPQRPGSASGRQADPIRGPGRPCPGPEPGALRPRGLQRPAGPALPAAHRARTPRPRVRPSSAGGTHLHSPVAPPPSSRPGQRGPGPRARSPPPADPQLLPPESGGAPLAAGRAARTASPRLSRGVPRPGPGHCPRQAFALRHLRSVAPGLGPAATARPGRTRRCESLTRTTAPTGPRGAAGAEALGGAGAKHAGSCSPLVAPSLSADLPSHSSCSRCWRRPGPGPRSREGAALPAYRAVGQPEEGLGLQLPESPARGTEGRGLQPLRRRVHRDSVPGVSGVAGPGTSVSRGARGGPWTEDHDPALGPLCPRGPETPSGLPGPPPRNAVLGPGGQERRWQRDRSGPRRGLASQRRLGTASLGPFVLGRGRTPLNGHARLDLEEGRRGDSRVLPGPLLRPESLPGGPFPLR